MDLDTSHSGHTFTSTASSNTFPVLSSDTYALIDEIVASLDDNAKTFEQIFSRYKQVLSRRGLAMSDDEEGYACLLKLSMQRGSTWKEKWHSAQKATVPSVQLPSLDVLRARLDSLDVVSRSMDGHLSLATPHYPLTSTPRRSRMLNAQAGDVSISSIPSIQAAPAKKRRVSFLSPQASNASTFIPSMDDPDDYEPVMKTPRRFQLEYMQDSPSLAPNPLISAADHFRKHSLLSHAIEKWIGRLESFHQLERKTSQIRNKLLIKRAVAVWRLRLKLVENVQQPKADAWRAIALKKKALIYWKGKAKSSQRARWEGQMRAALEAVRNMREDRILVKTWDIWREKTMIAKADRFQLENTADPFFNKWRSKAKRCMKLELVARQMEDDKLARLLYGSLERWHKATSLTLAEKAVDIRRNEMCLTEAWTLWFARWQSTLDADQVYFKNLLKAVMLVWKGKRSRHEMMGDAARELNDKRKNTMVVKFFALWRLRRNAAQFQRHEMAELTRDALHHWLVKGYTVSVEYPARADTFRSQKQLLLAKKIFGLWSGKASARLRLERAARFFHDETIAKQVVKAWAEKLRARQVDERKADIARNFFLPRRIWVIWVLKTIETKGLRLEALKDQKLLRLAFRNWIAETRNRFSENSRVEEFQDAVNLRIAHTALRSWVSRVVDRRAKLLSVAQKQDESLVQEAFAVWQNRVNQHAEDLSLAQSFKDVKAEEAKRKTFFKWLQRSRWNAASRERAEEEQRVAREQSLEKAFKIWRKKAKHKQLSRLALQLLMKKHEMLTRDLFSKWQHRTKILPALHFHANNTLRARFTRWKEVLPRRKAINDADELYAHNLTSDALTKWKQVAKARRARRAADRFKSRSAPLGRLPASVKTQRAVGQEEIRSTPSPSQMTIAARAQAARAKLAQTLLAVRSSSSSSSESEF